MRSSDGFEVQSIDRFSITYREDSLSLTVYVERGAFGTIAIEKDAFNQWDNLRMTNSPEKQAQMRQNFIATMKFQDITVAS